MSKIISNISKPFNSLITIYNKTSTWGKILIIVIIFLIVITLFKSAGQRINIEGFEEQKTYTYKTGENIYDSFYADVYEYLAFNKIKDNYEIGQIVNSTKPTEQSTILDIGSGIGNHVAGLSEQGLNAIGLDNSQAMIDKAKQKFPELNFIHGNALNSNQFQQNSFTHILCLYHTIYYFQDKAQFFANCMNWLQGGGYLVVHTVDREMFDPILQAANPLLMLTPQRHSPKRITTSKITFDKFKYFADYQLDQNTNSAKFIEKFSNKTSGKVFRKNEHQLYIEPESDILNMAQEAGFIIHAEIDLIKVGYEYNKLVVFQKPE